MLLSSPAMLMLAIMANENRNTKNDRAERSGCAPRSFGRHKNAGIAAACKKLLRTKKAARIL